MWGREGHWISLAVVILKCPPLSVNWPAQKPADYARSRSTLFTLRLMTQIDTTGTIVNRLALRAHAVAYT